MIASDRPPPEATSVAASGSSGAAASINKGYAFLQSWERASPLSSAQHQLLLRAAESAADRPLPPHLKAAAAGNITPREGNAAKVGMDMESTEVQATTGGQMGSGTSARDEGEAVQEVKEKLVLRNSHEFYKWHSEMEAAVAHSQTEQYRRYAKDLAARVAALDALVAKTDNTTAQVKAVRRRHEEVEASSGVLHRACEALVHEQARLAELAELIHKKLGYFDELENLSRQVHGGQLTASSPDFVPLLQKIDDCITYMQNNMQYVDANLYIVKFRQLQSRALGLVRTYMLTLLKQSVATVENAMKSAGGPSTIDDSSYTSILCVKFRSNARELKSMLEKMVARCKNDASNEYSNLMDDCFQVYCEQRLALVGAVVQERVLKMARSDALIPLARNGIAYLMDLCQLEVSLADHFFPSDSAKDLATKIIPLIEPLCTVLYESLRMLFIHVSDVEVLCKLADLIQTEINPRDEEAMGYKTALRPTLNTVLADVQERVTFRVQQYLIEHVQMYQIRAEDVNYPARLEKFYKSAESSDSLGSSRGSKSASVSTPTGTRRENFQSWFPPLERTLRCLSRMYNCVSKRVFSEFAQDAIGICCHCIQTASVMVTKKSGSAVDGQLFLIKYLLLLREQIGPFDVEFSGVEKTLDFSNIQDHMRRIFTGEASIFSFNSQTALPRIRERNRDSRKDLEKELKASCEGLIMTITKQTVEPMLSFITKVTAVKVAASAGATSRPIREQAFATEERLKDVIVRVNKALEETLPALVAKMRLYLQSDSTWSVLYKPVRQNIVEAHGQVLQLVETEYGGLDAQKDLGLYTLDNLGEVLESLASSGGASPRPSKSSGSPSPREEETAAKGSGDNDEDNDMLPAIQPPSTEDVQ